MAESVPEEAQERESDAKDESYGYSLYPERSGSRYKQGSIGESLFTFKHKCHIMLQFAMDTSKGTSASVRVHAALAHLGLWSNNDIHVMFEINYMLYGSRVRKTSELGHKEFMTVIFF